MSNFTGLISTHFKQLHKDAITELLRGCGLPCQLIFGDTDFTDCPNCLWDNLGKRSSGRYQAGGPTPFTFGTCPVCNGLGLLSTVQLEEAVLCVIYDYKKWIPAINSSVRSPEGYVQTISLFESTYSKLVQAKEMIANTDIDTFVKSKFIRDGEPTPCGFGEASFVTTVWKRVENG